MNKWITSWSTSLTPFANHFFDYQFNKTAFNDETIRMIIRSNVPGNNLRLKISNRFGEQPIYFEKITIAPCNYLDQIDLETLRSLTFNKETALHLKPGEERYSDPIQMPNTKGLLAVSIYFPEYTEVSTWHFTFAQSTFCSPQNQTHHANLEDAEELHSYYWISSLDVLCEDTDVTVVAALGDSLTDGFNSTPNTDSRWTDYLQSQVESTLTHSKISIINAGITGNLLLTDGSKYNIPNAGVSALNRLKWDILQLPQLDKVILIQGLNDIFGDAKDEEIINGYLQIAAHMHKNKIEIFIGTITPFGESDYFNEERENVRQNVNEWIRNNTMFDDVIDFDKAVCDSASPYRLNPVYNSGDNVHLNDKGYCKLASIIPPKRLF